MKLLAGCFSLFVCLAIHVHANTEKTIFLAPSAASLPPSLQALKLDVISPPSYELRRALPVAFPHPTEVDRRPGEVSWYLLASLNPNQRYEVRICWAATQPTEFWLDTFESAELLKDPLLERQLLQFTSESSIQRGQEAYDQQLSSHLLLRVTAAADFYTTNRTLMQYPPTVDVDIILDPYLANIFPKSLLPTAAYILVLALISWPISRFAWTLFSSGDSGEHHHVD